MLWQKGRLRAPDPAWQCWQCSMGVVMGSTARCSHGKHENLLSLRIVISAHLPTASGLCAWC